MDINLKHSDLEADIAKKRVLENSLEDNIFRYGKNSILGQTFEHRKDFTPQDFGLLSQGHQFLARLQEHLKYADDLPKELLYSIGKAGEFFHMDRILVIEASISTGKNVVNYQWNLKEEDKLVEYFQTMSEEEIENTIKSYDENGYIEYNPSHDICNVSGINTRIVNNFVDGVLLGNQLWIPTLKGGKYSGAVMFDRYNTTPYSMVEKFLLDELVMHLSVYIDKINAERENKAKSNFLSTMSHEIRTPMNAIVGMTEAALREDMSPDMRKYLKTVQSSAFGLLTLINDILDYSKIEAGKLEIVNEKFRTLSLINDLYEIVKARNNGKLQINMDIPDDLPSQFIGDSVRLKQVMINFCTNAIKYTDEGSVDIRIRCEKIDDKHSKLRFSVRDTGIGIKQEDLPRLFKQYGQVDTTVNHHKEGTGLGLMISKQLIEAMGGRVGVNSKYGKGSVFEFRVNLEVADFTPAGKLEEYQYDNDDEEVKGFMAPTAKVLVVDDTEVNLVVARVLFEPIKMSIDTANSGEEAIKKVENNTYDLILMDHFMPGLDGVETTKLIRKLDGNPNQNIPIIALTADAMSGVKEELISNGMNDFIAKPIVMNVAYQILGKWLPKEKII